MSKFKLGKIMKKICSILCLMILVLSNGVLSIAYELANAEEIKVESVLEAKISKYVNYQIQDKKGVLLQMSVNSGLIFENEEQYSPIKESVITFMMPKIENEYPENVEVIFNSTEATNGKTSDIVENYVYDDKTGELKITASNPEIEDEGYYNSYNEQARDSYEVICQYGETTYSQEAPKRGIDIDVNLQQTVYDENIEVPNKQYKETVDVDKNIGEIVSSVVRTENIYNGYIQANKANKTNYETEYKEVSQFMVSLKDFADEVVIEETNQFVKNNGVEIEDNSDLIYKETRIDKAEVLGLLGEGGILQIKKEDGTLIKEITKETETTEQGLVIVEYGENINKIIIQTTTPKTQGYLTIRNIKAIKGTMTDTSVDKIRVKHNVTAVDCEEIEESEVERKEQVINNNYTDVNINQAYTKVDVLVDTEQLTNNVQNEVIFTTVLDTSSNEYSLFENPTIEIKLPKQVEKVVLGKVSTLYDSQLQLSNSEVLEDSEGCKIIRVQLTGIQTQYMVGSAQRGNNIIIPATLMVSKEAQSAEEQIKVTYTNATGAPTSYSLLGNASQDIDIKINSAFDLQVMSISDEEVVDNTEAGIVVNSIDENALDVSVVGQVGEDILENGDSVYEGEVIKYAVTVKNTTDTTINNISITGKVPEGTVYATVDIGSYWEEAYKYVEDATKTEYTFGINSLEPGETKTEFYEVVVKDLENETEKNIANEVVVNVQETEYKKLILSNVIKDAKLKVEVISYIDRNEKSSFLYFLKVTNKSGETINNINLETSELQKEMTVNEAIVFEGDDVSRKYWRRAKS